MNAISIAKIYEEILKYYRELDMRSAIEESEKAFTAYQKRIHESYPKPPTITWNVSWLNAIGFDAPFLLFGFNNNSNPKFKSDKTENQWKAFSEDEYVDLVENELESVMRKVKKNFRYLMRNVLCQKMEDFKLKGTRGSYFIYKKDAPIIKTLLLHSVSENELDAIIRKWFSGKIPENAYDEIVLLSNRLNELISEQKDVEDELKKRWIMTFEITLRSDFANAMYEMECELRQLFFHSLPFQVDEGNKLTAQETNDVCHADIRQSLCNKLDGMQFGLPNTMFKAIDQYMETVDFKKLLSENDFPPVELMKLKSICEYLYGNSLKTSVSHADKIDDFTKYFISIDTEWSEKQEKKHQRDKDYYEKTKPQKGGKD